MAGLRGLSSFVTVAAAVLAVLRLVHVGVPLVFPNTRSGPIDVPSLDVVEQRVGFAPLIPAYRPASLGSGPQKMTVWFSPRPAFAIVWQQGDQVLSLTQRQGDPGPSPPPLSRPLRNVEDSWWWVESSRSHLVLKRDGGWISIETTLPPEELPRLADTLTPHRRATPR
jgi:hypothetical protein